MSEWLTEEVALSMLEQAVVKGAVAQRVKIKKAIDQLIRDTEDCPLYEGEERFWLLSAYRNVRRLVNATDQDLPRYLDSDLSPGQAKAEGVEGD